MSTTECNRSEPRAQREEASPGPRPGSAKGRAQETARFCGKGTCRNMATRTAVLPRSSAPRRTAVVAPTAGPGGSAKGATTPPQGGTRPRAPPEMPAPTVPRSTPMGKISSPPLHARARDQLPCQQLRGQQLRGQLCWSKTRRAWLGKKKQTSPQGCALGRQQFADV